MSRKEKSLALEFSIGWLIDLLAIVSLLSILCIPLATARESQAPVTSKDPAQPNVPVTATPEPDRAMSQALEAYASENSVGFMIGDSPLVQDAASATATSASVPGTPSVPITLRVLQGKVVEETDEVAMLVSEQCSQNGSAADGASSCERVYSNGHHATVLTQNSNEGDEVKDQTVIEEFDGENALLYRKTIRHRVDFNYLNGQKSKEKEFFDIIYQPAGKKANRELMVYEYFLDSGKTRSLSWTQYQQIAGAPRAELAYHAMLRYGDDGNPDRGLAERWDHGVKVDTFMDWSRRTKGFATLDEVAWGEWEGWIRNVSLQAYLP